MKLDNLEKLHKNMVNQNIIKTKFDFQFRNLTFSIIYIAESFPHILLFGCIQHNLFFTVNVDSNYEISTYLGDDYNALVKALDLDFDPNNKFSPNVFFGELREYLPTHTNPNNVPTMLDVARHSRDVEEADKIYFFGWKHHDGVTSNCTDYNLEKTKRICGQIPYEICKKNNISSRWTDNKSKTIVFSNP